MARIAFVQNMSVEYLGVMYLSAVLKTHSHTVELFLAANNIHTTIKEIKDFKPDLVGFSCTTGIHAWALLAAAQIKQSIPCRIIFGGPHPTYFPEIIYEAPVDIICRGEGEYPLLEIADKIDRNAELTDTLNCWFKKNGSVIKNEVRPLLADLDELPFPDRELYVKKYPYLNRSVKVFMAGRGCPYDCSFCFNHAFKNLYRGKGKILRTRSVENLIAEIDAVRKKFGIKTVYMQDDTFILNKKWVAEFADVYKKKIGLPFVCLIRADLVDDQIIGKIARGGCKNVFFGIESGSETLRNMLLHKRITDEQIMNTSEILKKYHIKFRTYNILGLPGETLEDAFKTVTLNAKIGTDYPWCSLFYPFPGTLLADYAKKMQLINASCSDSMNPSFFKESFINSEFHRELTNLQKLFFYGVKFPKAFPVIKKLIRMKPNILFEIAFLVGYAWCYLFSENLTVMEMISTGIRNVNVFFFSRVR